MAVTRIETLIAPVLEGRDEEPVKSIPETPPYRPQHPRARGVEKKASTPASAFCSIALTQA
jgi:hypothetical protein